MLQSVRVVSKNEISDNIYVVIWDVASSTVSVPYILR